MIPDLPDDQPPPDSEAARPTFGDATPGSNDPAPRSEATLGADAAGSGLPSTPEPEFADATSGLIDELEQILGGDFDTAEPEPAELDQTAEIAFPLADPDGEAHTDDYPAAFGPAEEFPDEPHASGDVEATSSDQLPPTDGGFWHAEELQSEAEHQAPERPRFGRSRDFVTIAILVVLIVGAGVYSAIQLSRDPVVGVSEQADLAAGGERDFVAEAGARVQPISGAPAAPVADNQPPSAADPGYIIAGIGEPGAVAVRGEAALGGPFIADPVLPEAPLPDAAPPDPLPVLANPPADETPLVAADPPAAPEPAAPAPVAPAGNPVTILATTNAFVNMRAGPDNDAPVISVVAEGATVEIVDCNFWCEVIVDGTKGWIYQDFLETAEPAL